MDYLLCLLALGTFLSTLIGGLVTLKFRDSLPYFFAFAAGSIIAVAFLDILPETIELAEKSAIPIRTVMLIIVGSFFFFSLIEKLFVTHHIHDDHHGHAHVMGPIGASSMIVHSFLDGAAIGLAFQVDVAAGIIVALAVILHDMTDGINTVVLMLKNKHSVKKACTFLVGDALAPVVGLIVTSLIAFPESWLVYILAFFVGEFIYIGAATLLPETRDHPSRKLIIAMALGMGLIILLTGLIVG